MPPDRTVRKYPRTLLLDSGAFTAWNAGQPTTVEEVTRSYDGILSRVKGRFDEIICVNLDVIPGERGRTATKDEILSAFDKSDENFEILVKRFGPCILPVFHQDEEAIAPHRLKLVCEQAEYICLSPRNDLHEAARHDWSVKMHQKVFKIDPKKRTHGLATTGNKMIKEVPWFSVDSAAWVLHGGMAGKIDFYEYHPAKGPSYRNFFASLDGGKQAFKDIHILNRAEEDRLAMLALCKEYGFTYEQIRDSGRIRSLICMGELSKFFGDARTRQSARFADEKETWQDSLFDG